MNSARTRTDIFGIFLAAPRLTAPQLIALAKPLGITATNAKSHLSRLAGEGIVRRKGERRQAVYSLTNKHDPVVQGISARLDDPPSEPWKEGWLVLMLHMPTARDARENLRASLWFDGFRPWGREVWLRPAWPLPWAMERAQAYVASGAGLGVRGPLLGTLNTEAVRRLYRIEELDRAAHALAQTITRRRESFRSPADAFAERLHIGGRVVDLVGRDPRLPACFWPKKSGLSDLRSVYRAFEHQVTQPARQFVESVLQREP